MWCSSDSVYCCFQMCNLPSRSRWMNFPQKPVKLLVSFSLFCNSVQLATEWLSSLLLLALWYPYYFVLSFSLLSPFNLFRDLEVSHQLSCIYYHVKNLYNYIICKWTTFHILQPIAKVYGQLASFQPPPTYLWLSSLLAYKRGSPTSHLGFHPGIFWL